MTYEFLVSTYRTERLKVLSVWSMFRDEDMDFRPHPTDVRGRSVREQMVHQCLSEDLWFETSSVSTSERRRCRKMRRGWSSFENTIATPKKRLELLSNQAEKWWEQEVEFFNVPRSRAWVMVRRIAHTSHHRGQQTAMLRMLNRNVHSTYGPSADTGGLPKNGAPTIYAYFDAASVAEGEARGGAKTPLPGPGSLPITERPDR
jgi:uncharacterized damage-inducible protein DinB